MIDAHPAHSTASASRDDERATVPLDIAEWLRLAAAPTFGMLRPPADFVGQAQRLRYRETMT
jgi:hypothetical protein